MTKDNKIENDFLGDERIQSEDLHDKGSRKAMQLRRVLEDRAETKRLSSICGDNYWGDI
ncbi:MAG: hypothetical protein QS748_02035 [Candidatus Endonucleobacter bathymodioli]|uniref:Uncharacterized protein n=1 Tax=Candidatus Endonucleibacter bathymodioli TaxID=539814 RepID=A0AA90NRN8_9GAMM|nr:hypothetical protein [Candidatus Endonucleobacter bathymodioli]